jgi:hypothetical protein
VSAWKGETIVPRRFVFALVLVLVATMAFFAVGTTAYRAGVARGLAESGKLVGPDGGHFPYPYAYPYPYPYWFHPFGFGFGGFLFPLLFLFLLFGAFRRRRWGYGCGEGRYGWPSGVPPAFEEWHRRAHEPKTEPGQKA